MRSASELAASPTGLSVSGELTTRTEMSFVLRKFRSCSVDNEAPLGVEHETVRIIQVGTNEQRSTVQLKRTLAYLG